MVNPRDVCSIDEVLAYFFEELKSPEKLDDDEVWNIVKTGIGTDEQVIECFKGWFNGWESGGNINPPLDELLPEVLARYSSQISKA